MKVNTTVYRLNILERCPGQERGGFSGGGGHGAGRGNVCLRHWHLRVVQYFSESGAYWLLVVWVNFLNSENICMSGFSLT